MSGVLETTIMVGNRGHQKRTDSTVVVCADGFTVSVIAGGGAYCSPKPALCMCAFQGEGDLIFSGVDGDAPHDYPGPYQKVELGFPSQRPEPWGEWERYAEISDAPMDTVYGYVPVDMVRALIVSHGGEV